VIVSFADKAAERVWERLPTPALSPALNKAAHRKLLQLDLAGTINDLRIPPGNRLEKLLGDREGQHSIRINDQYRICFTWTQAGPANVEIVDYH